MRRLVMWLVAVVLLAALLPACGDDDAAEPVAEQATPTADVGSEPGAEPTAPPAEPATTPTATEAEATADETPAGPTTVTYRPGADFDAVEVGGVVVGVDGTVWAVLEGDAADANAFQRPQHFARFDPDGWVDIGAPEPSALTGLVGEVSSYVYDMDVEGGPDASLWLISTGFDSVPGVYLHAGDAWTAPAREAVGAVTGAAAPDGSLWTLALDGPQAAPIRLLHLVDGVIEEQPLPEGGIECVFCVGYAVDGDNVLWMASAAGVAGFDGDTWTQLPGTAGGLIGGLGAGGRLWALGVDGSHWLLGDDGSGGVALTRVGAGESMTLPLDVSSVEVDAACLADLGTMTPADIPLDARSLGIGTRGITGDAAGRFWLAVECVGLYEIDVDSGVTTSWSVADGLPSLHFRSLAAHPDGSIWVATSDGITRITGAP